MSVAFWDTLLKGSDSDACPPPPCWEALSKDMAYAADSLDSTLGYHIQGIPNQAYFSLIHLQEGKKGRSSSRVCLAF